MSKASVPAYNRILYRRSFLRDPEIHKLRPIEKFVYASLVHSAHRPCGLPGAVEATMAALADEAGLKERAMTQHVKTLMGAGLATGCLRHGHLFLVRELAVSNQKWPEQVWVAYQKWFERWRACDVFSSTISAVHAHMASIGDNRRGTYPPYLPPISGSLGIGLRSPLPPTAEAPTEVTASPPAQPEVLVADVMKGGTKTGAPAAEPTPLRQALDKLAAAGIGPVMPSERQRKAVLELLPMSSVEFDSAASQTKSKKYLTDPIAYFVSVVAGERRRAVIEGSEQEAGRQKEDAERKRPIPLAAQARPQKMLTAQQQRKNQIDPNDPITSHEDGARKMKQLMAVVGAVVQNSEMPGSTNEAEYPNRRGRTRSH